MTAFVIWTIGYCFTATYEKDREISKSFLWTGIILFIAWPIRLAELIRKDIER